MQRATVAHDLDFEVGEGYNKKDGLFLFNIGRSIKEIIRETAATSGACLFAINSVRLRSVSELKQVWKDVVRYYHKYSFQIYDEQSFAAKVLVNDLQGTLEAVPDERDDFRRPLPAAKSELERLYSKVKFDSIIGRV